MKKIIQLMVVISIIIVLIVLTLTYYSNRQRENILFEADASVVIFVNDMQKRCPGKIQDKLTLRRVYIVRSDVTEIVFDFDTTEAHPDNEVEATKEYLNTITRNISDNFWKDPKYKIYKIRWRSTIRFSDDKTIGITVDTGFG